VPCCQKYAPTDCFFGDWEELCVGCIRDIVKGTLSCKVINRNCKEARFPKLSAISLF